ncbi:MAG: hypothetical protein NC131_15580, partial [Roseburia sp.]|nr:hypothetical protein [Roseburia sp.]
EGELVGYDKEASREVEFVLALHNLTLRGLIQWETARAREYVYKHTYGTVVIREDAMVYTLEIFTDNAPVVKYVDIHGLAGLFACVDQTMSKANTLIDDVLEKYRSVVNEDNCAK